VNIFQTSGANFGINIVNLMDQYIFKNISYSFVIQLISKIVAFLSVPIIARHIGVDNFGALSIAQTIVGLSIVLSSAGTEQFISKQFANTSNEVLAIIADVIFIRWAISALISTLIILLLAYFDLFTKQVQFFTIFMIPIMFFTAFQSSLTYYYFGRQEFIKANIISLISNILLLSLVLIWIFSKSLNEYVIFTYLATSIIIGSFSFYLILKKGLFALKSWNYQSKRIFNIVSKSAPYLAVSIGTIIYYKIDIFIIGIIKGNYEAGVYNAAYKLVDVLIFFAAVITSVAFPMFAKITDSKLNCKTLNLEFILGILSWVGALVSLLLLLASDDIIFLIYGENGYNSASEILMILSISLFFLFVNAAFIVAFNAWGMPKISSKLIYLSILVNILLNIPMVYMYGSTGAATATVMSEIFLLYGLHFQAKKIGINVRLIKYVATFVSITLMTFFIIYIGIETWDVNLYIRLSEKLFLSLFLYLLISALFIKLFDIKLRAEAF
jgi:O-antigen/teichoic acid export membrane protein